MAIVFGRDKKIKKYEQKVAKFKQKVDQKEVEQALLKIFFGGR